MELGGRGLTEWMWAIERLVLQRPSLLRILRLLYLLMVLLLVPLENLCSLDLVLCFPISAPSRRTRRWIVIDSSRDLPLWLICSFQYLRRITCSPFSFCFVIRLFLLLHVSEIAFFFLRLKAYCTS